MPSHGSYHRSYRRHRHSHEIRLLTSTQARVLKLVCVGLAGLVGLIFIGAKLFPAQGNGPSHYMTAEQEKACFNAHMAGDEKLAAVICSPDQWRDAPQGRGK